MKSKLPENMLRLILTAPDDPLVAEKLGPPANWTPPPPLGDPDAMKAWAMGDPTTEIPDPDPKPLESPLARAIRGTYTEASRDIVLRYRADGVRRESLAIRADVEFRASPAVVDEIVDHFLTEGICAEDIDVSDIDEFIQGEYSRGDFEVMDEDIVDTLDSETELDSVGGYVPQGQEFRVLLERVKEKLTELEEPEEEE